MHSLTPLHCKEEDRSPIAGGDECFLAPNIEGSARAYDRLDGRARNRRRARRIPSPADSRLVH